jgi:hypothetical protein
MRTTFPFFALTLCACGSASPDAPSAPSTAAVTAAPVPDLTGRYLFALDESAPAGALREQCATKSGGDKAKADACYAEVKAEASTEGVGFEKDAQGQTVWVSFGGDEVYHTVPVALTSDGPNVVVSKSLAAATGTLAAKRPIPAGTIMRIEVVADAGGGAHQTVQTIAMNDPKKGRLVFHRAR